VLAKIRLRLNWVPLESVPQLSPAISTCELLYGAGGSRECNIKLFLSRRF
jgi:hypothetical protein